MSSFALYIHYPFCTTRCPYCGFATHLDDADLSVQYRQAMMHELKGQSSRAPWQGSTIASIFMGGGTPSLLPAGFVDQLLSEVRGLWQISDDAEITIEANPGTRDVEKFSGYLEAGINRLSIGAQSFHDNELKALGREHSSPDIAATVTDGFKAGFKNISLDLIYGLPSQTVESVRESAEKALALDVQHLSTYSLSIEPGTKYKAAVESGVMVLPDQDIVADHYMAICKVANEHDFTHYELTNFARRGYHSRHNFAYWRRVHYLGIGVGAHSFNGGLRFWNTRNTREYIRQVEADLDPQKDSEQLTPTEILSETVYLCLRCEDGISNDFLKKNCNVSELQELLNAGFLEKRGDRLHVPESRWLLLDEIVLRLL